MTSRRALLALPTLAWVAACTTTPTAHGVVTEGVAMSGTVTGPTGSVKGVSLSGLVDAYTGNYGGSALTVPPQWQHAVLLSAASGACGREGSGGGYAANEVTLRFTMIGKWGTNGQLPPVQPPPGDLPLAFQANGSTWLTTSDGVDRYLKAYFMKAKSNGGMGSDVAATSGTVTFTTMTASTYDGSYDVYFGSDHVTGSFTAPWCA